MYRVIILPRFVRQLKEYLKKHRSLKEDVIDTLEHFSKDQHDALGKNVYKVRLRTRTLPRGKSKSFRLIVLLMEVESFLIPITIYFKGDQQDISTQELNDHLEVILFELRTQSFLGR